MITRLLVVVGLLLLVGFAVAWWPAGLLLTGVGLLLLAAVRNENHKRRGGRS